MRWDREDELDLADIGGEAGAATHGASIAPPGRTPALAWLLAKPVITAPIVGATKLHHLDDALASVNVKLSATRLPLWRSRTCRMR